ncbi:hypothetical protein [Agrobacterium pusense]|nr:hypothetical protein [Agrobacterium pusense]
MARTKPQQTEITSRAIVCHAPERRSGQYFPTQEKSIANLPHARLG